MNAAKWMTVMLCILVAGMVLAPAVAPAEEKKGFIPDKALCEQMLRHGIEAYQRGKYLDAKTYFRKAIQADPSSTAAWKHYDLAAVFALAERVEQDARLISPGVSTRQEQAGGAPSAPAPPVPPAPSAQPAPEPSKKNEGFKIVDDEGC